MSNRTDTSGSNPEVAEKAKRRRFDAPYKLRVLEEADRCTEPGLLGELLRREGLYSSHLATWRRQRELGSLEALGPKKRGRKPKRKDAVALENERLARENRRLADSQRAAHQRLGLRQTVRGLDCLGEVVQSLGDLRRVAAELTLVDGQSAALQLLRLRVQGLCPEQHSQLAHQPRGRLGDAMAVRFGRGEGHVRAKRFPVGPCPHSGCGGR